MKYGVYGSGNVDVIMELLSVLGIFSFEDD